MEDYVTNNMDLTNIDNGVMGGLDADDGQERTETMLGIGALAVGASSFIESFVNRDNDKVQTDFDVTTIDTDHDFDEVRIERYESVKGGAEDRSVTLQIGANSFETIALTLGTFSIQNLGIDRVDAIEHPQFITFATDDAIKLVDQLRADMGAIMNRLGTTINNLSSIYENAAASRTRIRDTDFALETSNLTRDQILQQAGTSILAQASQLPTTVLNLLGWFFI